MKEIIKELHCELNISDYFPHYSNHQVLLFDIETTGFSPSHNALYLIGCIYIEGDKWILSQFIGESLDDQREILHRFSIICKKFSVLIHYNGDSFDIRFIESKLTQNQLPSCFNTMISLDLLKIVRPFQKILGLPNCKLKSVETFLGVERKDIYSGKDLIQQYQAYLQSGDKSLEDNLLLHNEEDLSGLLSIMKIMEPISFIQKIKNNRSNYTIQNISSNSDELFITLLFHKSCPFDLSVAGSFYKLRMKKNMKIMFIGIKLYTGTLYHYFENYKDYYYLPDQDEAIHKSVGRFLPSERRKQATSGTCYIKKHGTFIPMFQADSNSSSFYKKSNDKNVYFQYEVSSVSELVLTWIYQCFEHILD